MSLGASGTIIVSTQGPEAKTQGSRRRVWWVQIVWRVIIMVHILVVSEFDQGGMGKEMV